jgi:hypothetical protein
MAVAFQRQGYGGDDVLVVVDQGDLRHFAPLLLRSR